MSSMRAGRPISIAQASFRWNVAAYVTASRGTGRAADLDEGLAGRQQFSGWGSLSLQHAPQVGVGGVSDRHPYHLRRRTEPLKEGHEIGVL